MNLRLGEFAGPQAPARSPFRCDAASLRRTGTDSGRGIPSPSLGYEQQSGERAWGNLTWFPHDPAGGRSAVGCSPPVLFLFHPIMW